MPRVLIRVTQEDIDDGEPYVPSRCPVALAWVREYGGHASIRGHHGRFTDKTNWHTGLIRLPAQAVEFIQTFDVGKEVGPIEFHIEYLGKSGRI